MIERQVIVTWHTMDEKEPEDGVYVPVTVSGKIGSVEYDHALAIGAWYSDESWSFDDVILDTNSEKVTVHAWADLEPYGYEKEMEVKPCPFCGSTDVVFDMGKTMKWIYCRSCYAMALPTQVRGKAGKNLLIARWNRRADE